MIAKLEFTLPAESDEHHAALRGMEYKAGIESIRVELRGLTKHGHKFKTADEALEHMHRFVIEVINHAESPGF